MYSDGRCDDMACDDLSLGPGAQAVPSRRGQPTPFSVQWAGDAHELLAFAFATRLERFKQVAFVSQLGLHADERGGHDMADYGVPWGSRQEI